MYGAVGTGDEAALELAETEEAGGLATELAETETEGLTTGLDDATLTEADDETGAESSL